MSEKILIALAFVVKKRKEKQKCLQHEERKQIHSFEQELCPGAVIPSAKRFILQNTISR